MLQTLVEFPCTYAQAVPKARIFTALLLAMPLCACVQGLSNRGLQCFAGMPALQSLSLSYCPGISASGLGSLLLSSCSSSLRRVDLLCCAWVNPAEAQAVQDAVWGVTHKRVELSWSRHNPAKEV